MGIRRVLITGASSGIGRETAFLLAKDGNEVIVLGRDYGRTKEVFEKLDRSNNQNHQFFVIDLNSIQSISNLCLKIEPINGLVLSAGIVETVPIRFLTEEILNRTLQINFISPVLLFNTLYSKKLILNGSSIVFLSSIGGNIIGDKGNGAYAASKGAISAISKVMAVEFSKQSIRFNCVLPGMVKTNMTLNSLASVSKEQLENNEKMYPLGYGQPIQIANLIEFLISEKSNWVTGVDYIIDGGFSIV
jgi:NAD(P)-dependent dehydrogenase (short-subunit alcohol dehydrogenase family)